MDRKLARRNLRTGLIVSTIMLLMLRPDLPGGRDLHRLMAAIETEAPPVGEEVHMPEPSILPIVNAVGVTLALVGITLSLDDHRRRPRDLPRHRWSLWIRAASHEMSELPLDHSSH